MNRNLLIGVAALVLTYTNTAQADFTFHSSDPDGCQYIAGSWAGTAKISSWLIRDCKYHGAGTASPVDENGTFSIDVTADKDSGSFLCPSHAKQELTGTCINGQIVFVTDYGNLNGSFSENAGEAQGKLSVTSGISAEVSIQFERVY
jgi:hypothetical protein